MKKIYFIAFLSLLVSGLMLAQPHQKKNRIYKEQWHFPPEDEKMLVTEAQQMEIACTEEEMQWYKDAKLGVFVHWGPALSVTSTLSWGRNGERPAAGRPANGGVPPEVYDVQYKKFNPVNFDANQWMEHIKAIGAEYLVFTAKHHDGFCMFDAPNTDYDIEHTPYKKDIAKELADAAHEHGIRLFWYYSQPDWVHPDCLREKHYDNYLPYMNEQLEHLYSNYGRIDGIFFDGLGSKYWQWDTYHLMKRLKKLQPGLISNPRGGFGWPNDQYRGDFDTPEQSLGPVDHHRYWEACLTMIDKWLYHEDGPIKPGETVLAMLIQVVGNGGNLLLNFGPNGKGEFVKEELQEAYKIGDFLKQYGHTLYDTRRGTYIGGAYGASTMKGHKLYLHFTQQLSTQAEASFRFPMLPVGITSVKGITEGFQNYHVENGQLYINFDKQAYQNNLDNIVEITTEADLADIDRITTWKPEPLTKEVLSISASSVKEKKFSPEVIYQIREESVFSEGIRLKKWWEPENGDKLPWLQLDFDSAKAIQTLLLSENMRSHSVRKFHIEAKDKKGNWSTVYEGTMIGEGLRIKLNGEKVYGMKLVIEESLYNTQITAFNVYEE